jgi:microcystin-dependent protein
MAACIPFIGSVNLVGFNYAPMDWALCNGQLLSITQNSALFSIIGTYYGGNGSTNFALPDLRGRIPVGVGQGPGLPAFNLGLSEGAITETLTTNEIPAHTHTAACNDTASGRDLLDTPIGNLPAMSSSGSCDYAASSEENKSMSPGVLACMGGSLAHNNLQPYLVLNYIIALSGVYPSRP